VNVNDVNGRSTAYESASAARSAVPTAYRKSGLNITYLLSTGWVIEQFIGDDVDDWAVADNWTTIGPVSVTQNTSTGHTDITVGKTTTPVASVEDINELKQKITPSAFFEVKGTSQQYSNNTIGSGYEPKMGQISKVTITNTGEVYTQVSLYVRYVGDSSNTPLGNLIAISAGDSVERIVTATKDVDYYGLSISSGATDLEVDIVGQYGIEVDIEKTQEDIASLDKHINTLDFNVDDTNARLDGQKQNYVSGGFLTPNGLVVEEQGWNISDYIPFSSGIVNWHFGDIDAVFETYPALCVYDSDHNYLDYYTSHNYTYDRIINISVPNAAYIRVSFADTYKGDRNTIPVTINGVDWKIKEYVASIIKDAHWKSFPLGNLSQADVELPSGNLVYNNAYSPKRVAMNSKTVVPFENTLFRFRYPLDYPYELSVVIYYGGSVGQFANNINIYVWDETVQLPVSAKTLRIAIRARLRYNATGADNWVNLSLSQVEQWLSDGTFVIEYYDKDARDINERNEAIEAKAMAIRRVCDSESVVDNGMNLLPVFAHISDLHGDIVRYKSFLDYCKSFGVDFALNTGDSTLYNHPDNTGFVPYYAGKTSVPLLFCIGNHESRPTGQSTMFLDNMSELVTQQGYLKADDTPADHCYYYKDFDAKMIRVIAINYYEDGVYLGKLGQEQVTWFIDTLASTPQGYGVIVILHSPEDVIVAPSGKSTFMQDSAPYDGFYVGIRAIMEIVDAFIGKTTLQKEYMEYTNTITIDADFTNVDASTEFIAYACGHRHKDCIGYYQHSQYRQLCLCITCGLALFGDSSNPDWANLCDLPRGGEGTVQDAFNLYAIDRANGNIRIARIGANMTTLLTERDVMIMPYKDII